MADGHHRCKSASRVAETLRNETKSFPGESEFEYFPVVLFPMNQMKILPYNRVIKTCSSEQFKKLQDLGLVRSEEKEPSSRGIVSIYFIESWWYMPLLVAQNYQIASYLYVYRLQNGL